MYKIFLLSCLLLAAGQLYAREGSEELCGEDAKPCIAYGVVTYQARCALCHGSDGHGEGILSLSLKDYPNTNLLEPKHPIDKAALTKIIKHGATLPGIGDEMPPWGDELTATQIESVVMLVRMLHTKREAAVILLRKESSNIKPSLKVGRVMYHGRCALCHGPYGLGDGKMARIIKDPPPFDLTVSKVSDDYLMQLITKGGEAMGRSKRMPPWGTDLSTSEINSVIMYIKRMRE